MKTEIQIIEIATNKVCFVYDEDNERAALSLANTMNNDAYAEIYKVEIKNIKA